MAYVDRRNGAAAVADTRRDYVHIESGRVDWVDYLKGFCILLVVMLHAVESVEQAVGQTGWMHLFLEISQPMRMPAFFLASGLFFMRSVDKPPAHFFDSKILHFAYFYILWLTIQFAFKAPGMAQEGGFAAPVESYLLAFVQPFGTLWFIYILPVFFVVTRLVRHIEPEKVLAVALVLQIMPIHTGSMIIDPFASYYLWFFVGYAYSRYVFHLADRAMHQPVLFFVATLAIVLMTWTLSNWTFSTAMLPGWAGIGSGQQQMAVAHLPVVSLFLGLCGIVALVSMSVLLCNLRIGESIRWCGAHSIVIYLAFFLPMATTRTVLLKLGIIPDVGTLSLLVWVAAVTGPVVLFVLVRRLGIGRFLFQRPQWARVQPVTR